MWIRCQNSYFYRCGLRDTWEITGLLLFFSGWTYATVAYCHLEEAEIFKESDFSFLWRSSHYSLYITDSQLRLECQRPIREREPVHCCPRDSLRLTDSFFLVLGTTLTITSWFPSATVSGSIPSLFDDIDLAVRSSASSVHTYDWGRPWADVLQHTDKMHFTSDSRALGFSVW